eukprot:3221573-Rhodomonas_salina.6
MDKTFAPTDNVGSTPPAFCGIGSTAPDFVLALNSRAVLRIRPCLRRIFPLVGIAQLIVQDLPSECGLSG